MDAKYRHSLAGISGKLWSSPILQLAFFNGGVRITAYCVLVKVSSAQAAVKHFEDESPTQVDQGWIIARAFVAHEGVRRVELMPGKSRADFLQPRLEQVAAFQRDMRVLPSPDVQQFALDVARTL